MIRKPNYGQVTTILDGAGPRFRDRPANNTSGFVRLIKTDGPAFGASRLLDSKTFGSMRVEIT